MSKKSPSAANVPPPVQIQRKGIPFHFNVIALAVSFFFVLFLYKNFPSYQWLKDELIKENLKMIKKYPRLGMDEKLQAKIGYDYAVLKMIKDSTPVDAIILFPPKDTCAAIRAAEKAQNLNGGGIASKLWCDYYLYPRKVVYESSNDPNESKVDFYAILASHRFKSLMARGYVVNGYTVVSEKKLGK